ncbi:hypothetical protein B0A50_00763 [Salinomyces thailandicus]|uniref:SWI/SNF family DNA-dependent ATPase Ris1 n=1 Tax=Salinomyces thailandicus TaxID=706561 RepID=A0A4U0UCJ7_9PEZI|nr:hypothetical protein B0A50_00763 [Salinomyces thailandica]
MPIDLSPQATVGEIEDELDFQDQLIDTLDPDADDHDQRLAEIESTKRELEQLLQSRQRTVHMGMDGTANQENAFWQTTMDGRPASSSGIGFPSDSQVQGTKRELPTSLSLGTDDHRSKRPTPDTSRAPTPTSSFEARGPIGRPLGASNGSQRPEDRARSRQLQYEWALKRQRQSEEQDRALAQRLSQQQSRPTSTFCSSSRPSVQTTIGHNGSFSKPPPPVKQEMNNPSLSTHSEYRYSPQPQSFKPELPQPFKREPYVDSEQGPSSGQQLPQRSRRLYEGIVDLTGDDDDEDVSEIDPTAFTPSRRTPKVPTLHDYPMPGTYPTQMTPGYPVVYGGNPGYQPYQGTNHAFQDAHSRTQTTFPGYPNVFEELNHLLNPGARGNPFSLDDDFDMLYGRPQRKPLGLDAYSGQEDLLHSRYDAIADVDPTRTKEEIDALLRNIRPDEDLPEHLRVSTPEAMTVRLHKYQELGLTWLKSREENDNRGGILADDMGLGKTVQMLSLLVTHRSEDPRCKTTLIVAPVALMRQWKQEIQSKIKLGRHSLSVFIHHGSAKKKDFRDLNVFDVVLTTYGSLAAELKKLETFELRKKNDPNAHPYPKEKCVLIGHDAHWFRVVLDEAQCIKNRSTATARAAFLLSAKYRFCMTGTPMMNHVDELFSLVHFLRIRPYCRWDKFRMDFSNPLKKSRESSKAAAMSKLQALIKAILLRRTKQSMYEGRPILVLPDRNTDIGNPEFNESELDFYSALEKNTRIKFNKYYNEGTVGKQYTEILVLLLRLRQACCHPHLIKDYGVAGIANMNEDETIKMAEQLAPQVVARIREKEGNFDCSICLDAAPDPAIFIPCGHDACLECFSRITDSSNAIAAGAEDGEGRAAPCPICREPIHKKRITDLKSFKKVHQPELLTEQEREQFGMNKASENGDEDDGDDVGSDDDGDDDEDGSDSDDSFVVRDDAEIEYESTTNASAADDANTGPMTANGEAPTSHRSSGMGALHQNGSKKSKKAKGKEKAKKPKKKEKVTMAVLKSKAARNAKARKAYLRQLRETWTSSAKIDKTLELLSRVMDVKDGEKVLIFSQWTTLLDLLEVPIEEKSWGYRRYDGSMNAKLREDAVDDFRSKKDVRIMLVSLKAGNAGLNLNMASQVIIMDPFWNPFIEEQAIDRAHRLGQTRPVQVHRLLIKNTVEDRIFEIQERKRAFVGEALDEAAGRNLSRLGVQDLAYLFGVTGRPS